MTAAAPLRLGCFVPQGWRGDLDPSPTAAVTSWDLAVDVALRAERCGYGAVWVYDHLQGQPADPANPVFDPLLMLAVLAWATSKIRIGTMCLALPLYHPVRLAHQLACLDVISSGRLEVGLGAGSDPREAAAFGIDYESLPERIYSCGEAAELLRACWSPGPTNFEGRYSVVEGARVYPKPLQEQGPPIWIAGAGERLTLWQVARHGDGCSLFGPPERLGAKIEVLREHCQVVGRPLESVRIGLVIDCLVGETEAAADLMAEKFNRHGEEPGAYRARRLVGTPEACVQQLQEYLDLGVSEVCCYFPDAASSDGMERLAEATLGPRGRGPSEGNQ